VHTQLAGILYLVNLFRALRLPTSLELGIGAWALVELVARCLLGPHRTRLKDDAIWRVLAALDGREPAGPAGLGFRGPERYRLPESWRPRDLPASALKALFSGRRRRSARIPRQATPELHRLLKFLVPYLRWRLRTALRIPEAAIPQALLIRSGALHLTPSHLDAVMPLDEASVTIRRAGLDRNPGWAPEFGRVVTFHFR
jgi:hypothetical protein